VKGRLRRIENRDKLQDNKNAADKPTLRTRTERQTQTGQGSGQTQPQTSADPNDDPDRPTLHKRSEDDSSNP
jgi:hypothetical protein